MYRRQLATGLGVILAIAASASGQGKPEVGLEVGQPFPEIVLPTIDGEEPMSIASFRGEKVFLILFASW